ncbi:MAG TPA: TonB-dependent receptor [Candidatus Binatia bacterium]|jgi:vitamin B12 transporter|nr:TonB-dependent receptor [Candidatus Binatia bacterium]
MKVGLLLLFLFWLSFSRLPVAEPQEPTLPPVFVTSTRTETPLQQVTTSASVITAKDIQDQQAETVLEALRNVPGLDVVQSGSRGTATSVFIRGSESDHVLVLIDGVEVNSTTLGAFNFAHLTTDNVERIEILRGAGGTLYGSQAIGGVINIITKKGQGPLEAGLSLEGGNGSTHRQTLSLRGGAGKLGYSFSAARIESQGFHSVNDDYRNLAASARLDYQVTEDASLKGIFHFVKTDLGLFNNNNFASQPDPNAREAGTQYLGKLEWEQKILKNWDYRISGSMFKEHIKDSDDVDACTFFGFPCDSRTRDRFRPRIDTGEFQTNYRFEEWSTTTFGVEYKRRSASTSGGIDKAIRNLGYYLQEQFQFLDRRLIMIPGIRLDDNQSFGTVLTPSFSTAYLFRETGTKVKGSYAKGFKAPTLNELFFPPGFGCPAFGNPNLSPEKSWELNAGVEQEVLRDRVKLGVTYFHREVQDLIEGRPIPGDPFGCFRAENVGTARFDGVEWNLGIKLLSSLTVNANYTYLDWDTADGKLRRRPRHRGSMNLNFFHEGLNINLNANLIGSRDDFRASSPFGDITKPGYGIFDLASYYSLPWKVPGVKNLTLFGKIENLFNKKYEEADGFRARPLNFLLGVRATFGE